MKRARQYIGILAAAAAYYSVHEGAHLLCAVLLGTFKEIRFMGIGMQIDVYAERMTNGQLDLLETDLSSLQRILFKRGVRLSTYKERGNRL